jgi:hypothetical protein
MNKNQKQPRRTAQLEKKLAAYSLAGAAALIFPAASKASVVVVNVDQGFSETSSFSFAGSPFAGDITISASVEPGFDGTPNNEISVSTTGGAEILMDSSTPGANVAALGASTLIDPTSANWGTGGKMVGYDTTDSFFSGGDWSYTGTPDSILAFEYEGTGGLHTGWAEIGTTANGATSSFEILSYAYDTVAGQAISTPASLTPEPSALPLLALGGIGLIALRRRRSAKA